MSVKVDSQKTFFVSAEDIREIIAEYLTKTQGLEVSADSVIFEITPRDSRPHDDFHNTVMEHLKQAIVTVKTTS